MSKYTMAPCGTLTEVILVVLGKVGLVDSFFYLKMSTSDVFF